MRDYRLKLLAWLVTGSLLAGNIAVPAVAEWEGQNPTADVSLSGDPDSSEESSVQPIIAEEEPNPDSKDTVPERASPAQEVSSQADISGDPSDQEDQTVPEKEDAQDPPIPDFTLSEQQQPAPSASTATAQTETGLSDFLVENGVLARSWRKRASATACKPSETRHSNIARSFLKLRFRKG